MAVEEATVHIYKLLTLIIYIRTLQNSISSQH